MPNQKIKNPEMQIQKTPQMNIRDFANDLLATEKHITDAYSTYLNEASNQALYQEFLSIFTEAQNEQRELYNLMFRKGWYGLEELMDNNYSKSISNSRGIRINYRMVDKHFNNKKIRFNQS